MRRACRSTSVPHSVRTTPVRLLAIKSAPIMDSSRRMCALTAGWVRSSIWAVLVKLPSSQIATNVRRRSVGILILPKIAAALEALSCCQLSCITLPPCRRAFHGSPPSFYHHRGKRVQDHHTYGAMGRGAYARGLEPVTPRIDQRYDRADRDHDGSNGRGVEHSDEASAQET